jgi:DNA-binding MarR family transcriptional regulator
MKKHGLQFELKQKTPFSLPEEELYLSLLRTVEGLKKRVDLMMDAQGLSGPQYNVLRILRGSEPTGLPCGEIGMRMVTRDSDITRILDRLEKKGWSTRTRNREDKRVVLARITPKGLSLLKSLDVPIVELHKLQLGVLGKTEIKSQVKALETIREHLLELDQSENEKLS